MQNNKDFSLDQGIIISLLYTRGIKKKSLLRFLNKKLFKIFVLFSKLVKKQPNDYCMKLVCIALQVVLSWKVHKNTPSVCKNLCMFQCEMDFFFSSNFVLPLLGS